MRICFHSVQHPSRVREAGVQRRHVRLAVIRVPHRDLRPGIHTTRVILLCSTSPISIALSDCHPLQKHNVLRQKLYVIAHLVNDSDAFATLLHRNYARKHRKNRARPRSRRRAAAPSSGSRPSAGAARAQALAPTLSSARTDSAGNEVRHCRPRCFNELQAVSDDFEC